MYSNQQIKETLLSLAKSGAKKPSMVSHDEDELRLAYNLSAFTNKKRNLYDQKFDEEIRSCSPQWFQ